MSGFLFSSLAGLLAGIIGAMGLGGGGVLIIFLTVFSGIDQSTAQGINLLCFIPSAALALIMHSKSGLVDKKQALPLAGYGLIGAVAGSLLARVINTHWLGKLFGLFMLIIGVRELFSKGDGEKDGDNKNNSDKAAKNRLTNHKR